MKADLHIHTNKSDGSLSPGEVVRWAKNKGLDVMAITDHDTVAGLDEGRDEARKVGIKFVDGIELSTFSICEIHILGYNIDYKNPDFVQELQKVQDMRKDRNIRIGQKLKDLGINVDVDFSANGLGRMNIARQLVKEGYCRDINDAFDRYLKPGAKAYCEAKRLTPVEAVKLIKKYGGFASVAHPKKYLLDKRLDMLLGGLKQFGLDGMELNYPSHNEQDKKKLCRTYGKAPLVAYGRKRFPRRRGQELRLRPRPKNGKKIARLAEIFCQTRNQLYRCFRNGEILALRE